MAEEKKVKRQIVKKDDWSAILALPEARRVIWEILTIAKTFGTSFDDNPYKTAYNEGQRAVGSWIYNEIMRRCPERFLQAQNEMNSKLAQIERKNKELNQDKDENGEENEGQ